jgi:hypothetical protein
VRAIELAIGKDLQYIRVNGTLVGGLLGLPLFGAGGLPSLIPCNPDRKSTPWISRCIPSA